MDARARARLEAVIGMDYRGLEDIYREKERVLGDMTLGQWCAFLGAHEERHLGQIRSVIAAAGFPK